ncbi:MAG: SDR family oxidoreductase [Pseudanabaenaceae cyanobacterium]
MTNSNPTALVTGASSGIGLAIAHKLTQEGITTALVSRQPPALPPYGKPFPLDLGQVEQVKTKVEEIVQALGRIDLLINCAGIAYIGSLAEMPLTDWQQLFDLNLTSVFQTIQAVLPTMRRQQTGTIINVASIAAKQGFPSWGAYCASKFALLGLTQALAGEEQAHGIRVMAICPGSVNTPLWDTLGDKVPPSFDRSAMLTPETVADTIWYMWQLPSSAVITDLVLMPSAGVF